MDISFNAVPQIWDDYIVWFIFSDDGCISCRLYIYNDTQNEAVISDLYVNASLRKQGGATAILNWCFEFAKFRKCDTVSLRSDHDDWVRQWYIRLGFEVESSRVWLKKNI